MELFLCYIYENGVHVISEANSNSNEYKQILYQQNRDKYIWYLNGKPITDDEYKMYKLLHKG